ncbi:glycoside hydrolase family 9 protein [Carboxylicivirga sp. N1Y90]|uniref:glycoside hydrolase family 9 protein n=1 Tax=Carboxylicivirga fragile TaxID=3417571 RepID=UPI003D325CF4|nr:glycoside hydrolase family 9 protein [Marinilabiliaceae bacterium N1Y90]
MRSFVVFISALMMFVSCDTKKEISGTVLLNHVGYRVDAVKRFVYLGQENIKPDGFAIFNHNNEEVYKGEFKESNGQIDNWHIGKAFSADFSNLSKAGSYKIQVSLNGGLIESDAFTINELPLADELMPLLLEGFKSQRCKDPYDAKDKEMTFFGDRDDVVDVSGGWYDASGEKGKYLSHLSFSNYLTPQQLPMMVWNILETAKQMPNSSIEKSLFEEAAFGADYLIRVQDKEGYFYSTVFANWTKDPDQREIAAYTGQDGKKTDQYQAAFREGGGVSIAALARISQLNIAGEFDSETYLNAAIKGFDHLIANNLKYVDDGKENIIDDYCALLAAVELFSATEDKKYLTHARQRASNLTNRLMDDERMSNWLRADDEGLRPFFHGAEAGLPIIALNEYYGIETDADNKQATMTAINKMVQFELNITNEVNNPFGYARQYVKAVNEDEPRSAFFLPHQNESGYWWQGENARLASLATALLKVQALLSDELKGEAKAYAANQINWILGLNPYNMCMLEGAGRNNPIYKEEGISYNYRGGVCNGITAGFEDESDLGFMPMPYNDDPAQRWRWSEQWLQHGGWLMPALAHQQ